MINKFNNLFIVYLVKWIWIWINEWINEWIKIISKVKTIPLKIIEHF